MNKQEAVCYGKKVGVQWYVVGKNGDLYGGTKTREQAVLLKARKEKEFNEGGLYIIAAK